MIIRSLFRIVFPTADIPRFKVMFPFLVPPRPTIAVVVSPEANCAGTCNVTICGTEYPVEIGTTPSLKFV